MTKKASYSYRRTGRKVTMHKNVRAVAARIPHLMYLLSKPSSAVSLDRRDRTLLAFRQNTEATHPSCIYRRI